MNNLIYRARVGNLKAIEQCIKNGADVNIQNKYGFTALIEASRYGRLALKNIYYLFLQ